MAENLDKWPSGREPISKIGPSDGCGRDAVLLAVNQWYDFHEFGCHLGNVGLGISAAEPKQGLIAPAGHGKITRYQSGARRFPLVRPLPW